MWPVLVLMLTIFNHPRTNFFVWQTFLQEKKTLPIIASVFNFFHKKACQIKSVCPNISTRTSPTYVKNLKMLQLLWKIQLQLQYIPLQWRSQVCFPEEPGEFHAQEAEECHQEGGGPHKVLARGVGHIMDPFQAKIL
jgi:hypothetical protein